MNYKKNKKYFSDHTGVTGFIFLLIIACIALFVMGKAIPRIGVTPGIGVAIITILVIIFTRRPSDAYIDGVVNEEFQKLKAAALKKLGLDEEEISVAAPVQTVAHYIPNSNQVPIWDAALKQAKYYIKGKDFLHRTPIVEMHFFGFTENEIHYYGRYISLVSDTVREKTCVMHYKDVVSIGSDTEILPAKNPATGEEDPTEKIKFDFFSVNAPGSSIFCTVRNSAVADEHVNALRALVKQKKA